MFLKWLAIAMLLLTAGCQYQTLSVQKDDSGLLKLVGNALEASVSVDDQPAFKVQEAVAYQIKPGTHTIRVFNRDNKLVVMRELYIGSNQLVEVLVP